MSNEWIRTSERKPTASDFPIIFSAPGYFKLLNAITTEEFSIYATHWKLFRDAPPREDTQEEKDAIMIKAIMKAYDSDKSLAGQKDLINLALSFERSEIRQLLKRHQCGELPAPEVIREISKRVKLT